MRPRKPCFFSCEIKIAFGRDGLVPFFFSSIVIDRLRSRFVIMHVKLKKRKFMKSY